VLEGAVTKYVSAALFAVMDRVVALLLWEVRLEETMRSIFAVLALAGLSAAATGKIVDVSPYTAQGTSQVTVIQGYPNPIVTQGRWGMFTLTVALDGLAYSANFPARRGFDATDFIVGDPIEATVEGNNLIIKRPNGKTEKSKITRKARI
jgi:hypothetical protein